jgi:hypothetical protein
MMNLVEKRLLSLTAVSVVLVTLVVPTEILAWGHTGHEAVAYVAWQQMNKTARSQALELIKTIPQLTSPNGKKVDGFNQWWAELPQGLSADDQNLFMFMRAATWADSIKHVGFKDSDVPPHGVTVDQPMGFNDTASHGYWHFVDNGFTSDHSTVEGTPIPNAAVQILELRKDLAAETDAKLKAYELAWLEHLVGDIHQPLHGVTRFVAGKSDLGGNSVKITLSTTLKKKFLASRPQGAPGSAPSELHAFWDDLPGVTSDPARALRPAADFGKSLSAAPASDITDTNPNNWSTKSFDTAKSDGYVSPIGAGNTASNGKGFTITAAYYNHALSDAKSQVALAGARLAKMLNDIWPESH